MAKTTSFNILAVILIVLGTIFLLENFDIIHGAWLLWPILPLIMGIGFCMLFFKTRKDLVLLGMGIFTGLNSLFFFYLNFTHWALLTHLWPVFIVIIGITFLVCFILSRKRVLLYLSVILMALGASFIVIFVISTMLWPVTLVLAGVSFIIISIFERKGEAKGAKSVRKR
ncbi:hypothetical protein KY359_06190 [Candidatus Woesearchaeota archaeon]|nr:hypothetical protein [Candidatus Woesearchaeota archaeon]